MPNSTSNQRLRAPMPPAPTVHLLLLGFPGALLTSLTLTLEMFGAANSVCRALRRTPRFEVGAWWPGSGTGGPLGALLAEAGRGLPIAAPAHPPAEERPASTLAVVAAMWGSPLRFLRRERQLIREVSRLGEDPDVRLVGVGSGAFFLAEAGRLEGHAATTHWSQFDRFARRYPGVRLRRDHRIVESAGVYTVASINALADLVVHLVREWCGDDVGGTIERHFSYESRNPFEEAVFSEGRPHNVADELVAQAQALLLEDLGAEVSVADVARRLGVSPRTLHRRFRAATGLTPLELRRRARMEVAAGLLRRTDLRIAEVAERCGVGDRAYFTRQFRQTLGVSPREYRRVVRAKLFRPG